MTAYEKTGGGRDKWRDDPARDVVEELYQDLSEHLGTDGPTDTFGHPVPAPVGRLLEDDPEARAGHYTDTVARDSHDVLELSAEEAAMHLMDEAELEDSGDPLPEDLQAAIDALERR